MAGRYAIGVDLGTSAIKLTVLDQQARVAAEGHAAFPMIAEIPGQAEQEVAAWWLALSQAAQQARAALGAADWAQVGSIGLAGQLPSLVCLGAKSAFPRAITWADARADIWAGEYITAATKSRLYHRTGMPIDGRYLAPMLRYHHGATPVGATTILSAKDWLCWALTDKRVTDPSTAAGYGVYDLATEAWAEDLCEIWGLNPALLPRLQPAGSIAGPLRQAAADHLGLPAGLPVYVGGADSVLSAYALGGDAAGTACVVMGSSTIIMASADAPLRDEAERFLVTPHAVPGLWGREMDLLSTGTGHYWFTELLGAETIGLDRLAASSRPGAGGIACAPYLGGGEQGALWDPSLSGVLHGLTLAHSRADIARAFIEATHFEIRRCIDILAETAIIDRVILAGKITAQPESLQMLATILGRQIVAVQAASPAAYGAALLTLHDMPPNPMEMITINPGRTNDYEAAYHRHLDLFPRVARPHGR